MAAYRFTTIGFLSDFGLADEFVGVCHGVIRRLAAEVSVIDITHGIEPHDVGLGALVLARSVAYLPTAVHLAVVDPGVGSDRLGIVLTTAQGSCLVGPDNGLLVPAAERLGGATACFALENRDLQAPVVSPTFHGRDVFSPAAAHLARGVEPAAFGRPVAIDALARAPLAPARIEPGRCCGVVVSTDRFGNLETTIPPAEAARAGLLPGARLRVRAGPAAVEALYGTTFASAAVGEPVVLEDSRGLLAVCLNRASAAAAFGAGTGAPVELAVAEPGDPRPPRPGFSAGGTGSAG
jgi:S-adenosylmethionine hydrolase